MRDHILHATPACTFNGWIEQISVQAADFSILAISVSTLLVIRQKVTLAQVSALKTVLICASIWIIPLITSTTATAMGEMKPVSGNWCWISKKRTDLRYGFTHGWRFAIIFITIGIYSYIWWYVGRHFRSLGKMYNSAGSSRSHERLQTKHTTRSEGYNARLSHGTDNPREKTAASSTKGAVERRFGVKESDAESQASNVELIPNDAATFGTPLREITSPTRVEARPGTPPSHKLGHNKTASAETPPWGTNFDDEDHRAENSATAYLRNRSRQVERDVKRMLLMNGYPIMYVILWIPGLINRIMEASGGNMSSKVLAILQTSTQFIGFANSVTYGLSGVWRAER